VPGLIPEALDGAQLHKRQDYGLYAVGREVFDKRSIAWKNHHRSVSVRVEATHQSIQCDVGATHFGGCLDVDDSLWNAVNPAHLLVICRITRAGFPAATVAGGMSCVTTDAAPITARS